MVKSFYLFSNCFYEILTIVSFYFFSQMGLSLWEFSATRIFGSARLMDPSSELRLIISMWYMFALKIDTFANSFLMVSIEPGRKGFRKALHWKAKETKFFCGCLSKTIWVNNSLTWSSFYQYVIFIIVIVSLSIHIRTGVVVLSTDISELIPLKVYILLDRTRIFSLCLVRRRVVVYLEVSLWTVSG